MEIHRRRNELGEKLYYQHQNLVKERPDEDEGKLRTETAYSPLATEYMVYDAMLQNSRENERFNEFADKAHNKLTPEQKEIQEMAKHISESGVTSAQNKYLKTDEGKEVQNMLYEQQLAWLGELSGRKKHLGKRKK